MRDITAADICKVMPWLRESRIAPRWQIILHQLRERGIADTEMQRMAVATIAAESAGFVPISEDVSKFNTDLPNGKPFAKYDFRRDLGHGAVGDGEKYKGRGYIQITGRYNYEKYGKRIGTNLVDDPGLANNHCIAAAILAEYLAANQTVIRKAIRKGDLRAARRAVNGGSHGLDDFTAAWYGLTRL